MPNSYRVATNSYKASFLLSIFFTAPGYFVHEPSPDRSFLITSMRLASEIEIPNSHSL